MSRDSKTGGDSHLGNTARTGITRVGTVSIDPETGECVMAADFPGDLELRWRPDPTPADDASGSDDYGASFTQRENRPDVKDAKQTTPSLPVGRKFDSGAYRDSDDLKPDYCGYLSPLVIRAYGEYMTRHRLQSDGELRGSDNWKLGIPRDAYIQSMFRHFHDLWMEHEGHESREGIDEALGGLLFNVMGFWLEELMARRDLEGLPCPRPPR